MRTARQILKSHKGMLTLEELMIVLAVTSNLMSVILPTIDDFIDDAKLTKAYAELESLKTAVSSYWRNNSYNYPNNITTDLTGASPQLIAKNLVDPFNTDPLTHSYGYLVDYDTTFGQYFIIYTRGPRGQTSNPVWDSANDRVTYSGSGRVVSNAPVFKQ